MKKLERNDVVLFRGSRFIFMSQLGAEAIVRWPAGGTQMVPFAEVEFLSRPLKTGARFQRYEDGRPVYLLPISNALATREKLEELSFEIPETPELTIWHPAITSKRRCSRCWKTLRGTASDRLNHAALHQRRLSGNEVRS